MSPRTKEQNEEIRGQRMQQIMEAAALVYLDKGMQLEIRDVAARSGLGYGTVYHYYKNKLLLLEELLQQAMDKGERLVQEHLSGGVPPMKRLEAYYKRLLQEWQAHPGLYMLYKATAENFHSYPPGLYRELAEPFQERLHQPVVAAFREGTSGDPDKLANMMTGALIGYAGLHLHHYRGEQDLGDCVETLLAGIQERYGAGVRP